MPQAAAPDPVQAVRRFSRFYTRKLGILREGLLDSPYTLTEARVLHELSRRGRAVASEIAQELDIDPGYVSRIVKRFMAGGLIERTRSLRDGRRAVLSLSAQGRKAFARLDARSSSQVGALIESLGDGDRRRLVGALAAVEDLLGEERQEPSVRLRSHRPGDMGWIVQSHGALYASEYGWDGTFEALVAEIVAKIIQTFDAERERCWIAEMNGERVGSIVLVRESDDVARLRLLIVDPTARGRGIGRQLVDACIAFARAAGYRSIVLWTHEELTAARHLYAQAGFELIETEHTHAFGADHVSETWRLDL